MYPNQNEKQSEDDNPKNIRQLRMRRGPSRGRRNNALPEPDNVLAPLPASSEGAQFRAMAIQNAGPQLVVTTPSGDKTAISEQKQKKGPLLETQQQTQQEQQKQEFVLTTEPRPCFGWDVSRVRIQNLPMYFPRDMIQWERFPLNDLPRVLERISVQLRESSIQASLIHEPLSAKLQTCHENVELYLVFFRENSDGGGGDETVSMSVQRHKGDHFVANRVMKHLIDAAKGTLPEENDDDGNTAMDDYSTNNREVTANAVLAMERLIERCVIENSSATHNDDRINQQHQHPFLNQTPDEMTECSVENLNNLLDQPRRLDLRRQAMEYLVAMTDLRRTLSSQAIAGSLIVLQGKVRLKGGSTSKSDELNNQARTIQSVLLNILIDRELPGDRDMLLECGMGHSSKRRNNEMDLDLRPYFPEVDDEIAAKSADLPDHYVEYMNELFHLALKILVQSLEVVVCFSNNNVERTGGSNVNANNAIINVGENITKEFLSTASEVAAATDGNKDLYSTLLGCVGHAESKLANGYLACKALRLLALDHPGIKEQIKCDSNAKQNIGHAYQVGQVRHSLLKDESYQLWLAVCH